MARQHIRRTRRPKGDLGQRLTAYSTAAGALLALGGGTALISAEPTEAAVKYSGLKNMVLKNIDKEVQIGTADVKFIHVSTVNPSSTSRVAKFTGSLEVAGSKAFKSTGQNGYLVNPSMFNTTSYMGATKKFSFTSFSYPGAILGLSMKNSTTTRTVPAKSGFVGFRFKDSADNTKWHYGWIRVSVPSDIKKFVVVDYAYETTPDTPIHIVVPKPQPHPPVGGVVHDISDAADGQ